jgi:peptide/nickel transport system permease protein
MPTGIFWQNPGRFVRRKPLGAFGSVIALALIVVAVFAPFIATQDPAATNAALVYAAPGSQLLLGGDQLGRDRV